MIYPLTDIWPGHEIPITLIAKDQDEYLTLLAFRDDSGTIVTRWHISWKDRFKILFKGNLWLTILTFNQPLQPVKLETNCPLSYSKDES